LRQRALHRLIGNTTNYVEFAGLGRQSHDRAFLILPNMWHGSAAMTIDRMYVNVESRVSGGMARL